MIPRIVPISVVLTVMVVSGIMACDSASTITPIGDDHENPDYGKCPEDLACTDTNMGTAYCLKPETLALPDGAMPCAKDQDCPTLQVCETISMVCLQSCIPTVEPGDGDESDGDDGECPEGQACSDEGVCLDETYRTIPADAMSCEDSMDCPVGQICDESSSKCVKTCIPENDDNDDDDDSVADGDETDGDAVEADNELEDPLDGDGEVDLDGDSDGDSETDMDDDVDLTETEADIEPETPCVAGSICCDADGNFLPVNTTCDDEDPCSTTDHCNGTGACSGTPYSCNDHGTCNGDGTCTCETGFTGVSCNECNPNALGEYPYCFLPNTAFCITSQCFRVPPTHQTTCYDNEAPMTCPGEAGSEACEAVAFCGQDAQYPDAARTFACYRADGTEGNCSAMIPVAENEVVVDSLTGLMWQRSYASARAWADGVTYCDDLAYGGYDDWRLPSQLELLSIVDNGTVNPSIDTTVFRGTPSGFFWTATRQPSTEGGVRYVQFGTGHCSYYDDTHSAYTRCVRGGYRGSPEGTFNAFVLVGTLEPTVIHKTTGLEWQKAFGSDLTWQQSITYCETLDYAGHTDWRLPNVKELQSLINNEIINPCSDFPNMPSVGFWSSSTSMTDTGQGWVVGFVSAAVYPYAKTDTYPARCVRGEP